MMRDGLGEADLLAHAFAVAGDLADGGVAELHALESFLRELERVGSLMPWSMQAVDEEFPSGEAAGKGIELGAVADLAEEFGGIAGREAEDGDCAAWMAAPARSSGS